MSKIFIILLLCTFTMIEAWELDDNLMMQKLIPPPLPPPKSFGDRILRPEFPDLYFLQILDHFDPSKKL